MKNKQKIKRCPMCNGKAGVYQDYHDFYTVQCNRCGVSTLYRPNAKQAIYDWNRRYDNAVSRETGARKASKHLPARATDGKRQ